MMPDNIQDYPGNDLRPNSLALGFSAGKLIRLVGLMQRVDAVAATTAEAEQMAYDLKSLVAVAALGLLNASRQYLLNKRQLFSESEWQVPESSIRRVFEARELKWPFGEDDRATSILLRALADPEFLPWATLHVGTFLPTYRANAQARARRERAYEKALDVEQARRARGDKPKPVRRVYDPRSEPPTEAEVHEQCVKLWHQYAEALCQPAPIVTAASHSKAIGIEQSAVELENGCQEEVEIVTSRGYGFA